MTQNNTKASASQAATEAQAKAAKSAEKSAETVAKSAEAVTTSAETAARKAAEAVVALDMAVPEAVRSMAEKAVNQSREAYEKAKGSLEETVETLELSLDKAGQGAAAINRKVIDITQTNLNSGFDLAKELAGAKTLAEVFQVQSTYMRKQYDTMLGQVEEMRELSTRIATESTEPFKAQMTRSMEMFKQTG